MSGLIGIPITAEMQTRYLTCGALLCPVCNSKDLREEDVHVDSEGAHQEVYCRACRAVWTEDYHLVGISGLTLSGRVLHVVASQTDGKPPEELTVPAKVWSDDHQHEASFDAAPWFLTASFQDIIRLAECGWRGDFPADRVALDMEYRHPGIGTVLSYVSEGDLPEDFSGFEVAVDKEAALRLLKDPRHDVHQTIVSV